jgi:hypothetical protein
VTRDEDLTSEIKELQARIKELEDMLAAALKPIQQVQHSTQHYVKLMRLLLEHGGLTPDVVLPDVKDPISKDIVRVLLERPDQNLSQITDQVRSKRGTASRRIIRKKVQDLVDRQIIDKQQKGSLYEYRLIEDVVKKWANLLGINI